MVTRRVGRPDHLLAQIRQRLPCHDLQGHCLRVPAPHSAQRKIVRVCSDCRGGCGHNCLLGGTTSSAL